MKKICIVLSIITFFSALIFISGCEKKQSVTTYEIECTLSENVLTGTMTIDFFNHSENTVKELKFNLHANAFRESAKFSPISDNDYGKAYEKGINYGNMQVISVYNAQGELDFSIGGEDQNVLLVRLPSEVFPDERARVTIEYKITLANVIARTGVNSKTINLANFYPILCALDENGFYECVYYSSGDPYYSDASNYHVKFTCDKEYVVASSGEKIDATNTDKTQTNHYKMENTRSFALVLSKDFKCLSDKVGETEIFYYYYADDYANESLLTAKKSLEYFSKTFGEYKYKTYSVVQSKFIQGGMEFPALVIISDGLESRSYAEVIVHETAHQWWQTTVGNNEIEYPFLDEGLAEYSVVLFYENHPEYGMKRKDLIESSEKTYKVFCTVADKVYGKVNTVMNRPIKNFISEYEYVILSYVKPCIMYDYLRTTIGDKDFFSGLRTYYEKYAFKNATPYDLVGVYEKMGEGTNGFFEAFFNGKAII